MNCFHIDVFSLHAQWSSLKLLWMFYLKSMTWLGANAHNICPLNCNVPLATQSCQNKIHKTLHGNRLFMRKV